MTENKILSNSICATAVVATDRGFFGLTKLQELTTCVVDLHLAGKDRALPLILDFSAVRMWDIAALLWLAVGLQYYKQQEGLSFRLRLPDGLQDTGLKDRDLAEKSGDYLRRWRFDRALQNIEPDVSRILVPDQEDFFNPVGPRKHFLAKAVESERGVLQSLISRRLAEIRDLSDPALTGRTPISSRRITQCILDFQSERIGDILAAQCGIEKRKADLFSDHLLTEALLNIQEHPNATMGMVAISLMGSSKELVLSVVDNGDSIPQTIYPRYLEEKSLESRKYDREALSLNERASIADFATHEGITSKTGDDALDAGMGLTYIKNDSVSTFGGKLTIITDHVRMTYQTSLGEPAKREDWQHPWHGNLLRIAIPIKPPVIAIEQVH